MKSFITAIKIFILLTLLTGILYPLLITGLALIVFPDKANGSLISRGHEVIGSKWIGQQFDSSIYFTSRPSAVSYNPLPSGGSNFGFTNARLKKQLLDRKNQFIRFNGLDSLEEIPSEMFFASASGLDPHITPQAAILQVERIARARGYSGAQKIQLKQLIINQTERPQFLCFGQERVNVLLLNLEADKIK